ncbi:helix-turn-helix domain-containing protein [Saccharothrix sp. NPDC042600]|uniref:helix-turn-helix domain-containing protein n=1 Tax=Saccharothrix sp. NPDC042600 TaxID=3154492 RepID=UPI00341141E2|nr:helix-turn-helix domain-containing protein [Saccharothrix mutabilis subsp. capreolus]
MEALAQRLSQLDTHVEGALRVVMFYDTLMRRRVDLPALARASANLAECVTGFRLHGTGATTRFAPDGTPATTPAAPASSTAPVTLDGEEIGTVWLERAGPPSPLDDVVLDRLAIAAAAVVERYGPARTTMADPALVELVISPDTDEPARDRALRLLGFPADAPVRVAAVRSPEPLDRIAARLCPTRPVKAAPVGGVGAILATTLDPAGFPPGVRAGLGATTCPATSWHQARTALRFTTARQPVVHHDDLGALALLTRIPPDAVRANPDVTRLADLTDDDLATLDAYCTTASLRRAADLLHLHHTSVARRVEQIGRTFGADLTTPTGLTRARLALALRRLLDE